MIFVAVNTGIRYSGRMQIEQLDYNSNSQSLFAKLLSFSHPVFLDSGQPHSEQGRFDILSAKPFVVLTTVEGNTTIQKQDEPIRISDNDPFLLLQEFLGSTAQPHPEIPFCGGALGYFAYDLGRCIEKLPVKAKRDIEMPEMVVGIYDWAIVTDHQNRITWLVSQNHDPETASFLLELKKHLQKPDCTQYYFTMQSDFQSAVTRQQYATAFEKVMQYIHDGDCYEVCLTQRFNAKVEGSSWAIYQRLREKSPTPYAGFISTPHGAVLSCSPERFLKVANRQVETKPIKGTRPRGKTLEQDQQLAQALLASEKDRAENLMIVDLMRNDISKTCKTGSVKVPSLFALESFPAVHHLVSTVTGELADDKTAIDLLRGCFPGGSITGAPKIRAMEIIEELEPQRRSVYCGSLGYISFCGNMDTNIAIRTLIHSQNKLYCSAGGALVADSVCAEEYQECFDKVGKLLDSI